MRVRKRHFTIAVLLLAALAVGVPGLADYTGPDRVVSNFVWERKVCDYQAVYDPPGTGWYGCTLTLYEPPDGSCPSNVAGYFTPSSCGWPSAFCQSPGCSISRSSSIDGCNQGQPGCRQVEKQTTLPEATISGSITCASPGPGGWCRGGGALDLAGDEPLSGESILALEGTHNGATFACGGASCSVNLTEGTNDFTFWAISSFGDTSRMGSASGRQDSQEPSLSGSASGTGGDNGWYVSDVTVEASADDALSGLASLDVRIDGGGWTSYGGPFTLGDGSHAVELRAVDAAGNTNSDSYDLDIDTGDPFVDLDATPSFCPGCGETADITINVSDGVSGIASWTLTAGGVTIDSGSGDISQTISWDGSGLGGGTYSLDLDARDVAGNGASASSMVGIVVPMPAPTDPPPPPPQVQSFIAPTGASRVVAPTPTEEDFTSDSPTSSAPIHTPRPTATPRTTTFGGLPVAPADDGSSSGVGSLTSPPASAPTAPASALYGAAALAVIAGVTLVAAENMRRRKEEEARKREEMGRLNAKAEALDKARAAAIAAAHAEADLAQGQIVSAATSGEAPSPDWLAAAAATAAAAAREADRLRRLWRKEETLDPQIPPPAPAFDMATWKQQDNVEVERAQELQRQDVYQNSRQQEWQVGSSEAEPVLEPVPSFWSNPLGWVQATAINAGRQYETVRNVLTATLGPAADSLRNIGDPQRNPQTAAWRDETIGAVQASVEGWKTAGEGVAALAAYTADAVGDGRTEDVGRAAEAWGQAARETRRESFVAGLKGIATVVWGVPSTPVRLVTETVPNFIQAVSERLQGRDRAWDVVFTATMLEADVVATYAIAKPIGLVNRINTSLDQEIFGSPNWGASIELPAELQPAGVTGQWQNWDLSPNIASSDQAVSLQVLRGISIETPYGRATQEMSPSALQLRADVVQGRPIFRGGALGQSAAVEAQFWAPESPLAEGYAARYGVASFTEPEFVIEGTLSEGAPFITRKAPGFGSNPGGGIEVVTRPGDVRLDSFHMPDP